MKKFIGGVILGFVSGVVGTVVWACRETLKKEAGRKKLGLLLRDISVTIDGAADRLEDSGEEKAAVDCDKCKGPCVEQDFDLFDVCGVVALFSEAFGDLEKETERVAAETGKRDYFLYWLRDDEAGDGMLTLESSPVYTNYFGTLLTKIPLILPAGKDTADLQEEDWSWLRDTVTVREFLAD